MKFFISMGSENWGTPPKDLRFDGCVFKGTDDKGNELRYSIQFRHIDDFGLFTGGEFVRTLEVKDVILSNINADYKDSDTSVEELAKIASKLTTVDIYFAGNDYWKIPTDAEVRVMLDDRFVFDDGGCHMNIHYEKFIG